MVGSMNEIHVVCGWVFFLVFVSGIFSLVEQSFFMLASLMQWILNTFLNIEILIFSMLVLVSILPFSFSYTKRAQ